MRESVQLSVLQVDAVASGVREREKDEEKAGRFNGRRQIAGLGICFPLALINAP